VNSAFVQFNDNVAAFFKADRFAEGGRKAKTPRLGDLAMSYFHGSKFIYGMNVK